MKPPPSPTHPGVDVRAHGSAGAGKRLQHRDALQDAHNFFTGVPAPGEEQTKGKEASIQEVSYSIPAMHPDPNVPKKGRDN